MSSAQVSAYNNRVQALMFALGRSWSTCNKTPNSVVNGILGIGQSLSIGFNSLSQIATNYPGLWTMGEGIRAACPPAFFVPLREWTVDPVAGRGTFQTICSSMGQGVMKAGPASDMVFSLSGVSNNAYSFMAKGTLAYQEALTQVNAGFVAASNLSINYTFKAIFCIHGENDEAIVNTNYGANLLTWQSNYQSDIQAITGQTGSVLFFFCQTHSWTIYGSHTTPCVAPQQYNTFVNNQSTMVLVTPKYMFTYTSGPHLNNATGYIWLGEYYAKAYYNRIVLGNNWTCLYPLSVTRSGATITVVFNYGGLVIDTTLVTDPSGTYASRTYNQPTSSATNSTVTNYQGFEFMDDNATSPSANVTGLTITTTTLTNDTVVVTLSGTPTSTNKRLRYAFTMTVGNYPGATSGPRGNLRDSDTSFREQLWQYLVQLVPDV